MRVALEVGDGARKAQDPVIAARGELEAVGRLDQERLARSIRCRDLVEQRAFGIGIDPCGRAQGGEAVGLDLPRGGDAAGDLGAFLAIGGNSRSA